MTAILVLVFIYFRHYFSFCMKRYVLMKHTVQCSPVFTIQLRSRRNFVAHCSHCVLHSITESQCLSVVQYSHPSPDIKQLVHTTRLATWNEPWTLVQRRFVQYTIVMQVLPASPELWVQVYQTAAFAAKSWMNKYIFESMYSTGQVSNAIVSCSWPTLSSWRLTCALILVASVIFVSVRFQKMKFCFSSRNNFCYGFS